MSEKVQVSAQFLIKTVVDIEVTKDNLHIINQAIFKNGCCIYHASDTELFEFLTIKAAVPGELLSNIKITAVDLIKIKES